jgi:hypothetical protein
MDTKVHTTDTKGRTLENLFPKESRDVVEYFLINSLEPFVKTFVSIVFKKKC